MTVLLVGLVALGGAPATSYAAPTINIGDARTLPLVSTVTLKGTVTVPSGAFESGTFDKGFAIQDKTGGIYVSLPDDLGLSIGDQVEVTGQLAASFGLLILTTSAADVKDKGHGRPVQAQAVATNGLSEATEGLLLTLSGTITQPIVDDLPYGYRIFVDDGSGEAQVFVYASTGIDVSVLQPGQHVCVTGFGAQFDTHYELNPRIPGDIQTC
jgi:hypothetical protein